MPNFTRIPKEPMFDRYWCIPLLKCEPKASTQNLPIIIMESDCGGQNHVETHGRASHSRSCVSLYTCIIGRYVGAIPYGRPPDCGEQNYVCAGIRVHPINPRKIFAVIFVFIVFVYNLAKSMSRRHPCFSLDLKNRRLR